MKRYGFCDDYLAENLQAGTWCKWKDVEPLLARLAKLEAVRETAIGYHRCPNGLPLYDMEQRIGCLLAALAACDEKEGE